MYSVERLLRSVLIYYGCNVQVVRLVVGQSELSRTVVRMSHEMMVN